MNDDIKALRMKIRSKSNKGSISDRIRVFWQITSWPPPDKVNDSGGGRAELIWRDLYVSEDYPTEFPEETTQRMGREDTQYDYPAYDKSEFESMFRTALEQSGFKVVSLNVRTLGSQDGGGYNENHDNRAFTVSAVVE